MGYLRFILAVFVVISHAGSLHLPFGNYEIPIFNFGGRNAVCLFFIISGFYMSLILSGKYQNSLKTFYVNRMLRIFPTYWVVLFLGIFFLGNDYLKIYDSLKETTFFTQIYFFFCNFFILGSDTAYLISARPDGLFWDPFMLSQSHNGMNFLVIPPVFTIAIELVFYIFAPFLIKSIRLNIFCLVIAILFHFYFLNTNNVNIIYQYHLLPSSFLYFSIGILAHKMYIKKELIFEKYGYMSFIIFATLILVIQPLISNILLLLFPFAIPYLFDLTKNNKIDRLIGNLSYPIYIVHYSVLKFCWDSGFSQVNIGLFVLIVSILIGVAIHFLIEKPIEKYRIAKIKELNS